MSRPLVEINKSVPGAVMSGIKSEVRHSKNTRKLRKMTPEALATENAGRKSVGLPPLFASSTFRQRVFGKGLPSALRAIDHSQKMTKPSAFGGKVVWHKPADGIMDHEALRKKPVSAKTLHDQQQKLYMAQRIQAHRMGRGAATDTRLVMDGHTSFVDAAAMSTKLGQQIRRESKKTAESISRGRALQRKIKRSIRDNGQMN